MSFAYPSNPSQLVLNPSSFYFPAGQLTFVVGRSGSGKSTLANLLMRFYEPSTGHISLDGHSIAILNLDWLRQNVTLIQQSSILFNDTFLKNVALGARDPDSVSADDVQDACNMALLQSTIAGMPDGLDTPIGPSGYALSGGQRQRLALARAKLRDPPVLILDEVTSGLDPISRTLIMEAIRIWRRDKTTIVITHEVGHIEDHEYVYVLEEGHVVQEGLRRQLAEEQGLFTSLLASADDASSSSLPRSGGLSTSEDEDSSGLEIWDEELTPQAEPRSSWVLRHLIPDEKAPSGFFHRLPLTAEPIHKPDMTLSRYTSARRDSDAAAMQAVSLKGAEVQSSRAPHAERFVNEDKDAATQSLESLELFFLERLAKRKDKKKKRPLGPMLPSLKAILRTVWPTLDKTGKLQLVLGLLSCVVIAGSDVVFAFIFAQLLAAFWLPEGRQEEGTKWAVYLTIVAAVDAAATFLAYFFMEHVAQRWVNALRAEAIKRILAQPKAWFDKASHTPSRITQCLDRNAEEMRKLVGLFVPIVLTVTCLISASLVWALIIRWDLTLVTLAGLPVAIGTARANSLVSDKWESICDTAATTTGSIFSDTFSNIRVVRALTLEGYFTAKHDRSAARTYRLGVKRAVFVGIFYGLYQSMSFFITALVFFYGAKLLSQDLTTVTDVLRVINLVLFSLGTSVAMLANVPQIAAAKTTAIQMLHFANLSFTSGHESRGKERASSLLPVRMTNLRFAYPGAPKTQVLRSVNLQIDPGTCVAIVGVSGCGKSTIAALLLRLYEPTSNAEPLSPTSQAGPESPTFDLPIPLSPIFESPRSPPSASAFFFLSYDSDNGSSLTYANRPASALSTVSLRSQLAYVPQHPFLFPTTVRHNITYGLHDSSPFHSRAHIESAARLAGIHDFVISLPLGYDTLVGEGGIAVSGGQAQRLALARALVRHPRMLVLDEPTSALDAEGAERIRRLLTELSHGADGMAVVVITHSKEMMRVADRVVMVENGTVVESGGYEELVASGRRFAQMVGGGVWIGSPTATGKDKSKGKAKVKGHRKAASQLHEETLMRLEGVGRDRDRGRHVEAGTEGEASASVGFRDVKYH